MAYENLRIEIENNITLITIDRPKALNSLNMVTMDALSQAIADLQANTEVKVIILTGAGEKAFVAGGDISAMQPLGPMDARKVAQKAQQLFNDIEYGKKVVIGAINGYALGGGCELAMACDIRIASDNAKFGQPEIKLGIIPGWAGTQRLPRLIGKGKAKELMFTGDMISAEEAVQLGLANQVVAQSALIATAKQMAEKIAAMPQVAISLIKEAVNNGIEMESQKAFSYEAELFGLCFATEDQKEGMGAFLEKRTPEWKDR
ncbi:enoyl-CoA hydratase [Malonomonas rubra DSM 5091]|uniref:Enoyl-CoA hydratase n=1 Tax=Malonomonas rubra DSM 5091 TaxID=1122189 RepID=A0A1M6BI25_MALRU|nr:enoyl-CoA hydratase-related protein [Malonomonas rubra]SHI48327.1 enoyl-CoA hydratase [Malonomonas rubra DSM 5091]